MRIPDFLRPSRSIATRLTIRVVGTLFLLSLVLSVVFMGILWTVGIFLFSILYWTGLDVTTEKINNTFTEVEIAVSNNITEAEDCINGKHNEFYALEHLLRLNPNIAGAAIATNPEEGQQKGKVFAPYAIRDSLGVHTMTLTSKEYDYLHQAWFVRPLDEGKGVWTDPYVDRGGGEILMITYSMPMFNQKGELYAVHTADISLDWLNKQATLADSVLNEDYFYGDSEDIKGHSRCFIVSATGALVVHPDKNMRGMETFSDYFKKVSPKHYDQLAKKILSGEQGMSSYKDSSGQFFFVFYEPIERTKWTIATIVPASDIFAPVNLFVRVLFIVFIVGLLVVALVCRMNIHRMTKPLKKFAESANEIAKGNLMSPLPDIKSKDEMRILHDSFSTMQRSLVEQIDQIKKSNEEKGRIESELSIARHVQMSLLLNKYPAFPERTDVDVFARLTPAKEVGGDLYDYLIRDEKLYFCVGDVSGKGIPASMVMMVTRSLFRTAIAHDSHPGKIASVINDQIAEDNDSSMFVTMFIGVLDLPSGRLRYCNAGHNPPLLSDSQGTTTLACDSNIPLGVAENWKFSVQEIVIRPLTTIFLYTDGLTEAENASHEQFMEERMADVARQSDLHPKALVENMEKAVRLFVGDAEQNDDMTMLAVLYNRIQQVDALLSQEIMLKNDLEQVPQLAAFVDEVCETIGFDMGTCMSLNLAIEEAVVNVMSYGYPTGTEGDIRVEAKANDKRLKFIITDWGKPFDPTTQEEIDTTLSAEERHIGGLGIHLVRQIMDSINYERIEGKNVLTLRKKLI